MTVTGIALSELIFGLAGTIVIVSVAEALPPGPSQVKVKLLLVVRLEIVSPDSLAVSRLPTQPPLAVHVVASVDDHVKVVVPSKGRLVDGDALSVTVGRLG